MALRAEGLPLAAAAPYLAPYLVPTLQGRLSLVGGLGWRAPDLAVQLNSLTVDRLRLSQGEQELAGWDQLSLSDARIDLGQHERALQDAERARALFTAGGDSFGAVDSLWAVGTIHSWRGDLAQALAVGEQTLKLLMDAENDTLTAVHLGNLASRLCQRGQLPLAKARAEAGLLLGRQVGNREATGQALVSLGLIAFPQG